VRFPDSTYQSSPPSASKGSTRKAITPRVLVFMLLTTVARSLQDREAE